MATRALAIYEESKKTRQLREMFSEKEAVLCEEVLEAFWKARTGSKRYTVHSVRGEINTIMRVTSFLGKPFWKWGLDDLDAFFYDLAMVQNRVTSTQMSYFHHIATLYDFIIARPFIVEEIRLRAGVSVTQLCTDLNAIVHRYQKRENQPRPALSHDEITILFDAMDREAMMAMETHSKNFLPVLRDRVICILLYYCGLRISEALNLTLAAFEPNPDHPELGNFGFVTVQGKGSRGNGPKPRTVAIIDLVVAQALDWYLKEVRPSYRRRAGLDCQYIFISERGKRLGRSCFEARFAEHINNAGLGYNNFTPHSMRHSSVSHEYHRLSAEANRIKHGHVFGTTTQGYMHIDDSYIQQEFNDAISAQLNNLDY